MNCPRTQERPPAADSDFELFRAPWPPVARLRARHGAGKGAPQANRPPRAPPIAASSPPLPPPAAATHADARHPVRTSRAHTRTRAGGPPPRPVPPPRPPRSPAASHPLPTSFPRPRHTAARAAQRARPAAGALQSLGAAAPTPNTCTCGTPRLARLLGDAAQQAPIVCVCARACKCLRLPARSEISGGPAAGGLHVRPSGKRGLSGAPRSHGCGLLNRADFPCMRAATPPRGHAGLRARGVTDRPGPRPPRGGGWGARGRGGAPRPVAGT
jgi:hypothetical protein